jgi:aspartate-semialdehyde dehydrogenase
VRKPPSIALLGADEPLGEALLVLLDEREIGFGELFPLSLTESDACATVRGEAVPLIDAADFDWSRADILVNALRSPAALRHESVARQNGCRILGLGLGEGASERVAAEGALSVALHRILGPISKNEGLASVAMAAMLPVSAAGEEGVSELAAQTRALFAMESPEPGVFPLQIAFNLIPQVGAISPDGHSRLELDTVEELRALMFRPDLPISMTAIWAPLFYGAGMTLYIKADQALDLESIRRRLARTEGVTLMDTGLPGGVATPGTDAQESEAVFVSRIRHGGDASSLAMWLVIDMARLEATSMADKLENLIEN